MNVFLSLVSLLSVVISVVVSRFITQHIINAVGTRVGRDRHFLTAPAGSVMLFAVVFVVVWFIVSLILAVPWFLRIQGFLRIQDE